MGEVLDLFLPFLDEPFSYLDRKKRFDERMRKSYALEAILLRFTNEDTTDD